jgi:Tfp pilus assembly protein FimV
MPSRHHLLGIYSGRINPNADIGSVWWIDDLIDDIATKRRMPKPAIRTANLDDEMLLPDVPPPPAPEPADLSLLLDLVEGPKDQD